MSQDNIFREIDEELRSDRLRALWRRTMPYVIGAAIGVVAVVAVNEGWTWYHANNAAQSSDELYKAFDLIDGGDLVAAQTQLDTLVASGSGSYPMLARFRQAGVLARAGDLSEAVAAYDALATSQSDPRLRELALVLAGSLLVDSGTVADVEARVGTIAVEGNPLRNAAREALGLAQHKAGDYTAAQASFEAVLNDPLAQNTVKSRMSYYLAQMLSDGVIAAEPAAEAADAIDAIVDGDEAPADAAAAPAQDASAPQAPAAQ